MDFRRGKEFTVEVIYKLIEKHTLQIFLAVCSQLVATGAESSVLAHGTVGSGL